MTIEKLKVSIDNCVLYMTKRMKFRMCYKFSNTKKMFLHFYLYICKSDFLVIESTKNIKL